MEIKLDDKTLEEYVQKAVNDKIDKLTDDIINEKVRQAIFDKVDSVMANYNNSIKYFVEKQVRDYIKEICPTIDKSILEEVGQNLAKSIAYELRDNVLESIAYHLMPSKDDDDCLDD